MAEIEEIAKKFKKDMQKLSDESGSEISVSVNGGDYKTISKPETMFDKNFEELKEQLPEHSDLINKLDDLKRRDNQMGKQINKIKYDRKAETVTIEYSLIQDNADAIDVKLSSNDSPLPEFTKALDLLGIHVENICKLPKGYCDLAEIRGVSLSHSHDVLGAVITTLIPVDTANSPVVINTPHLQSMQYTETGTAPLLHSDCVKQIEILIKEAENYIDGKRKESSQMSLNL